jgi:hypothetical protein
MAAGTMTADLKAKPVVPEPAPGESALGVRVGSEAAVESGTGPVAPPAGTPLADATRVLNKDLRERDEKELEKRGSIAGVHSVSVNFEGLMMVEVDGREPELRSGSYTGSFKKEIKIRALSEKETAAAAPQPPAGPTQPVAAGVTTSRGSR